MENYINKIYVRVDEKGIVTKLFSSVFESPLKTDKLIDEGNEEYHAHVHLKYKLTDENGNYNYKYTDKLIELTTEEKKKLFPPIVPQPDKQQVLNAKLLQDNAEINIELEKQKQLNAQILLQLATGGSTNV